MSAWSREVASMQSSAKRVLPPPVATSTIPLFPAFFQAARASSCQRRGSKRSAAIASASCRATWPHEIRETGPRPCHVVLHRFDGDPAALERLGDRASRVAPSERVEYEITRRRQKLDEEFSQSRRHPRRVR